MKPDDSNIISLPTHNLFIYLPLQIIVCVQCEAVISPSCLTKHRSGEPHYDPKPISSLEIDHLGTWFILKSLVNEIFKTYWCHSLDSEFVRVSKLLPDNNLDLKFSKKCDKGVTKKLLPLCQYDHKRWCDIKISFSMPFDHLFFSHPVTSI
jgi:hypothetical protein